MFRSAENILKTGAIFGLLGVAIGAFGAHGLKPHLNDYQIDIFEKGVLYQFIHALAIIAAGLATKITGDINNMKWAAVLFSVGILFFSGSLYLLACRDLLPIATAWVGPITPIGGLCFMGGWIFVARLR